MTTSAEPATRHCTQCFREQLITSFHLQRHGHTRRRPECKDCHNDRQRIRLAKRRRRSISKHLTKVRGERDVNRVVRLVEAMVKAYGGFDQFVIRWKESLDNAPRNSLFKLKSLDTILHLMIIVGEQQERGEARQLRTATDEELEDQVLRHAKAIIERRQAAASDTG